MISRDVDIKCPWCGSISKLGEWNDLTYSKCINREMKRAFTELTLERAFTKKANTFYVCGKCEKWSRGSQLLIVNTDDEKLLKLGGEPIIIIPNK